ncbi:hypothetical protein JVT61DRAFT_14167 [Boletus reticuloceps]|uniref:Uncharacterized protein n=1 Tax=Boletus reticuloceps TaxID=495285 RepID=A0A8I3A2J6_9AGAM|nr:hypothetical protein JVT61DRAFT_14167 [Boletus reticuloceps]
MQLHSQKATQSAFGPYHCPGQTDTTLWSQNGSFLVSEIPSSEEPASVPRNSQGDSSDGHSFYGQNVASSSQHRRPRGSLSDVSRRDDKSPHNQFKTPEPSGRQTASRTISSKPLVESWGHPLFAPLPDVIIQRISNVNPVEMPNRAQFEENFARFLDGLPPELLETAALTPEVYADVCRFLSGDEADQLSDRLKMWVSFHHEKLLRDYINHIDNHPNTSSTISPKADPIDHELGGFDWTRAFERIPVRNQIYDILVYAHGLIVPPRLWFPKHDAAITWPMVEIFTQLCPLCSLRNKSNSSHSIKSEHPHGACDESTRH